MASAPQALESEVAAKSYAKERRTEDFEHYLLGFNKNYRPIVKSIWRIPSIYTPSTIKAIRTLHLIFILAFVIVLCLAEFAKIGGQSYTERFSGFKGLVPPPWTFYVLYGYTISALISFGILQSRPDTYKNDTLNRGSTFLLIPSLVGDMAYIITWQFTHPLVSLITFILTGIFRNFIYFRVYRFMPSETSLERGLNIGLCSYFVFFYVLFTIHAPSTFIYISESNGKSLSDMNLLIISVFVLLAVSTRAFALIWQGGPAAGVGWLIYNIGLVTNAENGSIRFWVTAVMAGITGILIVFVPAKNIRDRQRGKRLGWKTAKIEEGRRGQESRIRAPNVNIIPATLSREASASSHSIPNGRR